MVLMVSAVIGRFYMQKLGHAGLTMRAWYLRRLRYLST